MQYRDKAAFTETHDRPSSLGPDERARTLLQPRKAFMILLRLAATTWLITLVCVTSAQQTTETAPELFERQARILRDQVYEASQATPLTCDVYLPASPVGVNRDSQGTRNAAQSLRPAVVLIHGGAWSSGSKSLVFVHAQQLANIGIVAIAINYRHAPQHPFPAQVDDVRASLIWLKNHADEFEIDLNRVGLFGYSAGGHLACLLATLTDEPLATQLETSSWNALDPRWDQLPRIRAVVAGGPPSDFRSIAPNDRTLAFFLGGTPAQCPQRYVAASPAAHVSAGDLPICFIHGENDAIVLASDSRELFRAQKQQGVPSQYLLIAKQGHMLTFLHSSLRETMEQYFRDQFHLGR